MKRKSFITILATIMLLVLAVSAFTACGKKDGDKDKDQTHTHTYATEWSKDETNHWHAATCEHTSEKKDVTAHTFGEWTETKAPTYTEKGEKQRACTVCSYVDKQEVDALGAKENSLTLAEGIKESEFYKDYDKQGIELTKDMFVYNGDGELTFEFKKEGETAFVKTSPTAAGIYIVKVTVSGTSEWKTISKEYEYSIDKKKISIEDQEFYATYVGKEWKATLLLNETDGILDGDSVSLELLRDNVNDWTDGSSFELYDETAQKADNRERVRLVGNGSENYELEAVDSDGKLVATLKCSVQETQVNGSPYSESLWGTFPVADLKCGFSNFIAGGEAGSFAEKLFQGENAYKQFTLKVNAVVGTETTCIAIGTRIGLGNSAFGYEYNVMQFINNADKTKVAFAFDLIPNIEGFTDESGKWIYEGTEITLKLMVVDDTKTIKDGKEVLTGELVKDAYIVVKFVASEGSWTLNFGSDTIVADIGVYTVEESGLSENQWDTNHEFYTSGDDVCYIAIKVTTGISGGMTIENLGL